MPHLELSTTIRATPEVCFDLSLDVEVHTESTGAREEIIGGVRSGGMRLGDTVTWRARHYGIPFTMTSKIIELERPLRFVDEQVRGPFSRWHHEHRFSPTEHGTLMLDIVDYRSPLGPLGVAVDRLTLERHMTRLLRIRNAFLRELAERSSR
jgi:ligand-binding SRPBCC domain-containing protein